MQRFETYSLLSTTWLWRWIWFLWIGWWFGWLWVFSAWIFIISIIGRQVGYRMINQLPNVLLLCRGNSIIPSRLIGDIVIPDMTIDDTMIGNQRPLIIRIVWFILVGWYLSLGWMHLAYFLCATLLTFPIGTQMFKQLPEILTLRQTVYSSV